MKGKEILFESEARDRMKKGVDALREVAETYKDHACYS